MGNTTVAPCQESALEKLFFDVEDRCGRAVMVLCDVRSKIIDELDDEHGHGWALVIAAVEMITHDLNALANRALDARTCKAVA